MDKRERAVGDWMGGQDIELGDELVHFLMLDSAGEEDSILIYLLITYETVTCCPLRTTLSQVKELRIAIQGYSTSPLMNAKSKQNLTNLSRHRVDFFYEK